MFLLSKRSSFRFSIANLLVLITVVAIMGSAWLHDRQRLVARIENHELQRQAFGALNSRARVQIDHRGKPISAVIGRTCNDEDLWLLRYLPTLREVDFSYRDYNSDGVIEYLLHLPELEVLHLSRNNQQRFTDKSLATIAKIRSLKELYLRSNQFSEERILQLISLPNLRKLEIRSQRLSAATVAKMRTQMPNTEIDWE